MEPVRLEKRPELFQVKPLLSVATDVEEPSTAFEEWRAGGGAAA
jgi:hypothetical protein